MHFHLSQILMLKNPGFLNEKLKIPSQQFLFFLSFMSTFFKTKDNLNINSDRCEPKKTS